MTVTGATLNRGRSKQDYGTPREFIDAVESRFGKLVHDLACTRENAKAPSGYYWPEIDSLAQPWRTDHPIGNLWLNPPFENIGVWAAKCATESPGRHGLILLLTPASIGANWFAEHVYGKAMVFGLSPRMTFDGATDPYPKDLMLSVFGMGINGFDVWRWK
jgi:phage N-6-adenine-methyltransferase